MSASFYWVPIPGVEVGENLPGKLIVLEGTDGVGRSTQTRLLRNWLESSGLAVYDTGLTRGGLAGRHIQDAKEGHTMGRRTQALYYATDFADRLEKEILPAMRAGYVVLTDRYIYSLMARAAVRGIELDWLRKLYGFAMKPDLILYLKVSIDQLMPRILASGGFDYWESGMDYQRADTMYDAFVKHQTGLLEHFDRMAEEYGFVVVDANRPIRAVFHDLQRHVRAAVQEMTPGEAAFTDFVGQIVPIEEPELHQPDKRPVADILRDFFSSMIEEA